LLQLADNLIHVALALRDRGLAKETRDARGNLRADDLLAFAVRREVLLEDRDRLAIRIGYQAERDDRRDAEILLRGPIRAFPLQEGEEVVLDLRADLRVGRASADEAESVGRERPRAPRHFLLARELAALVLVLIKGLERRDAFGRRQDSVAERRGLGDLLVGARELLLEEGPSEVRLPAPLGGGR